MRDLIIWTLSILLSFEPALARTTHIDSRAKAESNVNDIKSFLEKTQITQQSVSLRKFYDNVQDQLPEEMRKTIEPVAKAFGAYRLPKFDVSKVKLSDGKEHYQLQAVQDGQAISITFVEGERVFMKVNGQNLSAEDMQGDIGSLMKKMGADSAQTQLYFPSQRGPASVGRAVATQNLAPKKIQLLSAQQIKKLSLPDRKKYFHQFRQLLASMEAAQNALIQKTNKSIKKTPKKTSRFDYIQWLISEAWAADPDEGKYCVAAGYIPTVNYSAARQAEKGRGLSCGVDSETGTVAKEWQGNCQSGEFLCNPLVYGPGKGKLCASAGPDTTAQCNSKVSDNDIPDLSKNPEEFNQLKAKAQQNAEYLMETCGLQDFSHQNLTKDQVGACENVKVRVSVIESWTCSNDDFVAKYGKTLCPSGKTAEEMGPRKPIETVVVTATREDSKTTAAGPSTEGGGADGAGSQGAGTGNASNTASATPAAAVAEEAKAPPTDGPTQGSKAAPDQGPTQGSKAPPADGPTQGSKVAPDQGPTQGSGDLDGGISSCSTLKSNEAYSDQGDCGGNWFSANRQCRAGQQVKGVYVCQCAGGKMPTDFKCVSESSSSESRDYLKDRYSRKDYYSKRKSKGGNSSWIWMTLLAGAVGVGAYFLIHAGIKKSYKNQVPILPLPPVPPSLSPPAAR
ncbi:MAG: hypothetical protein COT73_10730 [Bdellovibrio sp. CG10_big_fil_rev_8_21_14_0_10_47_8]|nr:MAG: hypothetical protein COT73_10730 [Bdellovibrio sp. CG10_big_fil_rev_8_21_14_0_10_47_8]